MIRQPAVAGQFYEAAPSRLQADVARYSDPTAVRHPVLAAICPHAGLLYSGPVAGAVYSRVLVPPTVILIGPNHTGMGPAVSVYPEGAWRMPDAEVPVHDTLARDLLARFPGARADTEAHRWEHCLEVQLPFLLQARHDVHILPIILGTQDARACQELGQCLAALVRETTAPQAPPLLVASTDLNHYESDAVTRRKDQFAIDAISRLDGDGLLATVREHGVSMCGAGPTATVLHAVRALGATTASLIRHSTSGDVSGDLGRVVGYAGFTIP